MVVLTRLRGVWSGTLKHDLEQLRRRAADKATLNARVGHAHAKDWGKTRFGSMAINAHKAWPHSPWRSGPQMLDTGRLSKSFAYIANAAKVEVFNGVPYARQLNGQSAGGADSFVVRIKRAKWLTIPNPKVLTPAQVRGAQARDFQGLVARKGIGGYGLYATTASGRDRKKQGPLFWLRKQVTIKTRPFLYIDTMFIDRPVRAFREWMATGKWIAPYNYAVGLVGGKSDVGRSKGGRP